LFAALEGELNAMSMSFQEQNQALRNAEQAILNELKEPTPTADLVRRVLNTSADEYSTRAAIWFLIGRGKLEIRRENNQVLLAKV
jgi:hypothetical protein